MQLESTLSRRSLSYRVTPQNTFFSTFCLAMTSSKLWSVFLSKFILSFELLNPTSILSQIKWVFFFCISFCLWHLTFAQLGANHGVRLADIFKVPTSTPHYSWFSPLQRTTTTTSRQYYQWRPIWWKRPRSTVPSFLYSRKATIAPLTRSSPYHVLNVKTTTPRVTKPELTHSTQFQSLTHSVNLPLSSRQQTSIFTTPASRFTSSQASEQSDTHIHTPNPTSMTKQANFHSIQKLPHKNKLSSNHSQTHNPALLNLQAQPNKQISTQAQVLPHNQSHKKRQASNQSQLSTLSHIPTHIFILLTQLA